MHHDEYKIRSSVQPQLVQNILLRGTLLGALGAFLLIFCSIFIPEELLAKVGLPLFFISFGIITLGLLPYRKLKKLELRPHEIVIHSGKEFIFAWQGAPCFTIPFDCVECIKSISSGSYYGIAIKIRRLSKEKITVLNGSFDLNSYVDKCRKKYSCDIFLPYFTQSSFQAFEEFIKDEEIEII